MLEDALKKVINDQGLGEVEAYLVAIIDMEASLDKTLSAYISKASESHSLLPDEIESLRKSHPAANGLDYVHFILLKGMKLTALVYVSVAELWDSNYVAGLWRVDAISDKEIALLERITL